MDTIKDAMWIQIRSAVQCATEKKKKNYLETDQ